MADVVLHPLAAFPSGYTHTCDTVWQKLDLDPRSRVVTVENRDASSDLYVAFDKMGIPASAEEPADNGAVGTHYSTVPASQTRVYRLREDGTPRDAAASIYIAGASGTPVAYVEQSKGPA